MTFKYTYFRVNDTLSLPSIEAWVKTADNCGQLLRTQLGDSVEWRVIIHDAWNKPGHHEIDYSTHQAEAFIAEFGSAVEQIQIDR